MKKILIALALIISAVALYVAYDWIRDNKLPNFYGDAELFVRETDTPEDVLDDLEDQLEVLSMKRLRKVFRQKEVASYMKPGHYLVNSSCSSVYVARMLNNGWQTPVRVTLSGSLRTKGELARKVAAQLCVDSAAVRAALEDEVLMKPYGVTPDNVFAAFFPATYDMYWTAPFTDLLDRCANASDAFWTDDNLVKAAGVGLTRREAVVLASIVKGESRYKPELPKIAGVYLNRLNRGMKLQADPTVAYCYDYELRRILFKHLDFDSPYNTYKNKGLPPAPINVPDREYIEAVLNPDYGGGNLFFCASSALDGTHVFAKTMTAHGVNAKAFRDALKK